MAGWVDLTPSQTTPAPTNEQLSSILQLDPSDTGREVFERRQRSEFQSPEHALAFAVLQDTLSILTTTALNRRKYREYQEAEQWLYNAADPQIFSFTAICDYLNIDAAQTRRMMHVLLESIAAGSPMRILRTRRGSLYARALTKVGG